MMLRQPTSEARRRFLETQSALDFSYADVGATANEPPAGYVVDRTRIEIGTGEEVFRAARDALRVWRHFHLGWSTAWPSDTSLEPGRTVVVVCRALGVWWLNACRIVYVIDESTGSRDRFGFAYGTLPGHAECGEERFLVEWDRDTDRVHYEILAFSRPQAVLTWLGYPLARRFQKRFGRDSAAALFRAVQTARPVPEVCQQSG